MPRKIFVTAALIAAAGASPLAGAESRYEWLVGQLQITEGEQVQYANRAFARSFSPAQNGPEGKKALGAVTDRDAWFLQQLQMSDGNDFGSAFK